MELAQVLPSLETGRLDFPEGSGKTYTHKLTWETMNVMVHFFSLVKLRGYEGSLSPPQDTSKEEPSGFCIKLLLVLLMLG